MWHEHWVESLGDPEQFETWGFGRIKSWQRGGLEVGVSNTTGGLFPQIAGSYRGSNFSKGGIVLANWPTSGCCSECCAGCCPGCCCGCCPGCSGSCLPLGGVRVLSRVLCRVLRIMFAIGWCQGAVRSAPDHVCHCCPGCCSGCSGSCLPLGGVRMLSGCCPGCCSGCSGSCLPLGGVCAGCCQGAPDHVCHWAASGCCPGCCAGVLFRGLRIMFAIGRCQGAVQGAPDHVCHWAVSGCCPGCCSGCSGSCLPLGGVRVLSRVLFRVAGVRTVQGALQGALQSALQGAPDHVCQWAVSGCCAGVLFRVLRIMFAIGRCQDSVQRAVQGARSCLPLGGVRVLSRVLSRVLRIMFAIGRCQGAVQGAVQGCCWGALSRVLRIMFARALSSGAVQGAPDHVCYWAVSGCCQFNVLISIWGLCWCNFWRCPGFCIVGDSGAYLSGVLGYFRVGV